MRWLLAVALLVGLAVPPAVAHAAPVPAAAPSADPAFTWTPDPYFPNQGNAGIDVQRYRLDLRYDVPTRVLVGVADLRLTATADLASFTLDLDPRLTAAAVTVDGRVAAFSQPAALRQKLLITPALVVESGETIDVVVRYRGRPGPVRDPDGSKDGWVRTDDGAVVVAEPQGSPTWFPGNDTPVDKAAYRIRAVVDRGLTAISNGELVDRRRASRTTVAFTWRQSEPMATYLATLAIGRFDVTTGRTHGGLPLYTGIDPRIRPFAVRALDRLPGILRFFSRSFGPYPFSSAGSIVDVVPGLGYALETQTRPVYAGGVTPDLVAHETAHQWFGNSLTLGRWQDIWMNEGFASWAEWYWSEHVGRGSAQERFERYLEIPADSRFWTTPPADPGGPENLFNDAAYVRGAMTLQALRQEIGDGEFLRMLRSWVRQNQYGTVSTEQFRQFAADFTGRDLDRFFDIWLDAPRKPSGWRLASADVHPVVTSGVVGGR